MKKFFSVEKSAHLIGVAPSTLYRWINRGRVSKVRSPGGQILLDETVVVRLSEAVESYRSTKRGDELSDDIEDYGR